MSASPTKSALYCLFHNDNRYTSRTSQLPISHIFSAVIRPGKGGYEITGQDYDGKDAVIMTDVSRRDFNLAAIVPITVEASRSLTATIAQLNQMSAQDIWPFYFSVDMAIKPHREMRGRPAIAPEGHIDPLPRFQKTDTYSPDNANTHSPEILTRARINCVRMTLLAARLAGIDVPKIADLSECFSTGEEVRDRIRTAVAPYKTGRHANPESRGTLPLFGQKDRSEAQITGASNGLSVIEAAAPVKLDKFIDALSRQVEGRTMFDWMTKGKAKNFVTEPAKLPAYLEAALKMALSENAMLQFMPASEGLKLAKA